MNEQHIASDPHFGTPLPEVEEAVLVRFSEDSPTTDQLFETLKEENPRFAWWLLREAQKLGPDINDKEKYAQLALRMYGALSAQALINNLREAFESDSPAENIENQ